MSDIFENMTETGLLHGQTCRVAYTINYTQPVICTYISDMPLFYMDYADDELSEEELFDEAELGLLDKEIKTLQSEMAGLESSPLFYAPQGVDKVAQFSENAADFSNHASAPSSDAQTFQSRLDDIIKILENSRVAQAYLSVAQKHKVTILMSNQVENAFYDRRSSSIMINPDMGKTEQILLLARELRRHWQHRQGVLINPLMFQPEHAILVNRALEADLIISVIRTAWELQLAGIRDVWERVENSPMADLARSYAREAFMDFRTINNGVASTAVFETWFLSERCRQQDKKIIQSMLADYKGYVFENIKSSEVVSAELISSLGSMPFGKNYLAQHATTIMNDPVFTEVRDRSNANFLWFIKFERSFKEAERELQLESDLSTHGIRHGLLNKEGQDLNHGNPQSADIIELFANGTSRSKPSRRKPKSKNSADIIDIRRWSGK